MEHLFSSIDWTPEVYEYPGYVDYLEIPFLDYPNHHSRSAYLQAEYGTYARVARPSDLDDTPFISTWLFGSLLQEFFGEGLKRLKLVPLYRHADFVRPIWNAAGDRQIVLFCTVRLMPLLEQWSISISHRIDDCERYYQHLRRCLTISHNILAYWARTRLQWETEQILTSIGDLLSVAMNLTFRRAAYFHDEVKCPISWPSSSVATFCKSRASELGWCRSEAARMQTDRGLFVPTAYFRFTCVRALPDGIYASCPSFEQQQILQTTNIHADCSETECRPHDLRTLYSHRDLCPCGVFHFRDDDWQQLLRVIDYEIPLLKCRVTEMGSVSDVSVVPFQSGLEYVAISHVWSHGLGNPKANELPNCRLQYTVQAVLECWKLKGRTTYDEVLLWLDTLCCPVLPLEARAKVIATMRAVYSKAAYVLVLDGELSKLKIGSRSVLETGVRILASDWMKRLWTLQEGFLAQEVWIKFKDTSFSLDSLQAVDPYEMPFNQYRVARYVKALLPSIRQSSVHEHGTAHSPWLTIEAAVVSRRVTVTADEALCLSTLMDLDTRVIVDTAPLDRMRRLWTEVATSSLGIPKAIVFKDGPKLSTSGFRWAPVSLLERGLGNFTKQIGHTYHTITGWGTLTANGLLVHSNGLLLAQRCMSVTFKTGFDQYASSVVQTLRSQGIDYIRDQHGSWFALCTNLENLLSISPTLDLLSSAPEYEYAVVFASGHSPSHLVRIESQENDIRHVSIVQDVLTTPHHGYEFSFAYRTAQTLANSDDFQAMDYEQISSAIANAAVECARSADARELYELQGYDEVTFRNGVFTNTMLILSGYYIMAESVPETHKWCYT